MKGRRQSGASVLSLRTWRRQKSGEGGTMRFDLVDLGLFIAIAEARSITQGAERSALALASASARVKRMEETLGVTLLRRLRRGIALTPAGESLLAHARIVLSD